MGNSKINANTISIRDIQKKYGLPYSTINHYTVIGLLHIVGKKRNIRLYDESQVKERMLKINELKNKGYPLHLIQQELNQQHK